MGEHVKFREGDQIEVIDKACPYSGKTGEVKKIVRKSLESRKLGDAEWREGEIIEVEVELEGVNKRVSFWSHPKPLDSQIRKL